MLLPSRACSGGQELFIQIQSTVSVTLLMNWEPKLILVKMGQKLFETSLQKMKNQKIRVLRRLVLIYQKTITRAPRIGRM